MGELLQSAVEAARIGGALLRERMGSRPSVQEKGMNDFVTDVDRESQAAIIEYLGRRHPDHGILAEEGDERSTGGGYRWIIDPLDGTTNFIHGFPCFAVSVGVWRGAEGLAGAVLDPVRDELFHAELGGGAWLGERRIRVSDASGLAGSLLVTGFPFRRIEALPEYLRSFQELLSRSAGVRRDGSAALDLCHVACGRADAFWEPGLSAWDVAAGAVIVREAGGIVSDYDGGGSFLDSGDIVAAAPGLHAHVLEVLRRHHPAASSSL